ncbi:DDB1- and CUL4-associated factor 8 [Panicum miliaceum]|uniref:DDB1-and CUL4-associated factor 8 n=1 Tax=Panicum miliaceum TaxID=4540 RepID=A0A3L6SG60_PANMI|nr:DDB1- and CUL4-associated factor 8 [Panicum miliaceum]
MATAVEAAGGRKASCFFEVGRREIGSSFPRASSRRISGSEHILMRMTQYGKLRGHDGCVNTVSFNPAGDLLVSGSDDTNIILWDWLAKTKRLVYPSGHHENVFHARVMPFTDDSTIVTVAADGQVRVGQLKEGGEVTTRLIGEHDSRVHKMAIEPGSPYIFYSCGEDGLVQHFDLRSDSATKLFTCYSFLNDRRRVRLSSIAIDPQNPYYFSIGGSDEYVRLYDMRRFQLDDSRNINQPVDTFCPKHLVKGGKVHITSIAYSYAREILVSYNDELVYLFQSNMGLGPNPVAAQPECFDMLDQPQAYSGHRNYRTVKGVSFFGPNDEYVVSGSDCGNVFIWRKKGGELMRMMNGDKSVVNCIEPHPHFPFMATSGIDKTVKLWTPSAKKVMSLPKNVKEIITSNERWREVNASRAEVTLSSDVIMHVLRLRRRQSELHRENEPAAADLASDDDEAFYIGFGNTERDERENSDPR